MKMGLLPNQTSIHLAEMRYHMRLNLQNRTFKASDAKAILHDRKLILFKDALNADDLHELKLCVIRSENRLRNRRQRCARRIERRNRKH